MIRIGICDDIYDARMQLHAALGQILDRRGMQNTFVEFPSGEAVLRWLATHCGELDVLFLDIKMSGIDGMETAERIRDADHNLELVFVTSYADRVFDGYSVNAMAYLMKPVKRGQLEPLIDRVLFKMRQNEQNLFFCRYGDVTYRIPYLSAHSSHDSSNSHRCLRGHAPLYATPTLAPRRRPNLNKMPGQRFIL